MASATAVRRDGLSYLNQSYVADSPGEKARIYDEWAATYDADMTSSSFNYIAPKLVADALVRHLPVASEVQVVDAGCGTGLVGVALASRLSTEPSWSSAAINIDGIDLSNGMLKIAQKTGVYRKTIQANLNQPLSAVGIPEATYTAVISSGTLTHGHVGPEALSEFVKVTKVNGIIASTVIDDIWESEGFRAKVDELVQSGDVVVLENELGDYRVGTQARVIVLRREGVVNGSKI